MKRTSREECFMNIAKEISKRSTCKRAQVGAVLVHQNSIVATGYNGSLPGAPHCIDSDCLIVELDGNPHCIRTIHAEMNAILHLEREYEDLTLFVTHFPCKDCIKALVMKNVTGVYYEDTYGPDEEIQMILRELKPWHNIQFWRWK